MDAEWERSMRENPTRASTLGDTRYNDQWPDLSFDAIAQSHAADLAVLAALDDISIEELSQEDRINYQLFRRKYALRTEEYGYQTWLIPLDQRGGIQDEGSIADQLQFDTVQDYEDWLTRMRTFPVLMAQTIDLMRKGIDEGVVHSRVVMERLPGQIAKQIVDDPEKQLFYKPFRNMPDSIPEAEQQRLRTAAKQAVEEQIVPAYVSFQGFFKDEYLPACFEEVGVWQAPRGEELYALRCRRFTTTDLTPDEIHEIGLREVARIREEMEAIQEQVGFEGTYGEFLEELRTNPKFYYDDPADLLREYLAICKKVDPQLVKLFRRLPRIPYGVDPIPAHIAPDTTTAYYMRPAADGTRAGTFFVNLYRPETRPKYEMEALSLHEAVPGHHLQIALAQEIEGLPRFRRLGGETAFIEGWGLYSESLGEELGLYQDPYSKFGQLTYEMWRAIRLVVDTGMHHKHWTRQQAIDLFMEHTAKSRLDIENEVDRYIAWPGQALAYKIGELKIRELRTRAEETLGDSFDIRAFHDVVLRHGAVPLNVLENQVDEWIADQQQTNDD